MKTKWIKYYKDSFPKEMKHRKARIIASWTIIALMILSIIGGTIGVTYIQNIANQSPDLNPEDFTAAQSSKIFITKYQSL